LQSGWSLLKLGSIANPIANPIATTSTQDLLALPAEQVAPDLVGCLLVKAGGSS